MDFVHFVKTRLPHAVYLLQTLGLLFFKDTAHHAEV